MIQIPLIPEFVATADRSRIDPELFFPEKGGYARPAKLICQGCEARLESLAWAMERDERFGIWGGLTERERRRLKHDPTPSDRRRIA